MGPRGAGAGVSGESGPWRAHRHPVLGWALSSPRYCGSQGPGCSSRGAGGSDHTALPQAHIGWTPASLDLHASPRATGGQVWGSSGYGWGPGGRAQLLWSPPHNRPPFAAESGVPSMTLVSRRCHVEGTAKCRVVLWVEMRHIHGAREAWVMCDGLAGCVPSDPGPVGGSGVWQLAWWESMERAGSVAWQHLSRLLGRLFGRSGWDDCPLGGLWARLTRLVTGLDQWWAGSVRPSAL